MLGLRDHLTKPNTVLAEQQAATPPGMAHWAGTGPAGETCETCVFFGGKRRKTGIGVGDMQARRCQKYRQLMRGALKSSRAPVHMVPPKTPACSHFAAKPKPAANAAP